MGMMKKNQRNKPNTSKELMTKVREKLMVIDQVKLIPKRHQLEPSKRTVIMVVKRDNMTDVPVIETTRRRVVPVKETGVQTNLKETPKAKMLMLQLTTNQKRRLNQYCPLTIILRTTPWNTKLLKIQVITRMLLLRRDSRL